jgi:hypothetical protein
MILRGMLLLARGRAIGIKEFANSSDALAASLAPLIAFPLVGAVRLAVLGQPEAALIGFLARLCAVLALPVITHQFARVVGRETLWLRTVTALDWSFWLIIPLLVAAAVIGAVMVKAGMDLTAAEYIAMGLIAAYVLWYHWFTVRAGLLIGVWQAVLLVVLNSAAVALLTDAPLLMDQAAHLKFA